MAKTVEELTIEDVREAEEALSSDRQHVNKLVGLVELCEAERADPQVQLAAMQACRSVFGMWMVSGELQIRPTNPAEGADKTAVAAYCAWLLRFYRRFAAAAAALLSSASNTRR